MRPVLCPVLVGRDDEAGRLREALAAAGAGHGGTVLLAGEPGVGKSRLARELADLARQQDYVVLIGRAVAGGVPTPFRPFAEAMASALRRSGLRESAELDPFRPALARLVPQVLPGRAAADDSLIFLGEAVLRLLRVVSPDHGCVVLLEDLHWADRETLALLEYVADNLGTERVLCVGTFRPDEGSDAAELAAKLEARGSAGVLPLGRLDQAAVADMALACLGAGQLPAAAQSFLAERADGIPFLVEEVLAGLLGEGVLVERQGRWEANGALTAGVPATFADAVARRLDAAGPGARWVMCAAAVLGRRFDWSLLSHITRLGEDAVLASLRQGVELQLILASGQDFRFRHALTQEAVLAGLLPPERTMLAGSALEAVQAAHPGLPGTWCTLAADLAERAGLPGRAAELLLQAGRRDVAVGALASAEGTLARARSLAGTADPALRLSIDAALTDVFSISGQVDRAIEMGRALLAMAGPSAQPVRSADLHLRIAQAAIAGGLWTEARQSVEIARGLPDADLARVDACAARAAGGRGDLREAERLARAALAAAQERALPDVACEALGVIGRVARHSDLAAAERAFTQAEAIASANGLAQWRLRALHEIASVDYMRTGRMDKLLETRELSQAQGSLALTATLDLQIAVGLNNQFRADEALAAARKSADASRRFHLVTLPIALIMQAAAHAIRGDREAMEARIAEAIELAPDNREVLGCAWGFCRATASLVEDDYERAWSQMDTGAALLLDSPVGFTPPFLGLWPLLGAALRQEAAAAVAKVRAVHGTRHLVITAMLGYAEAVIAGRAGEAAAAQAAFAAADAQLTPVLPWYRHYALRVAAEAALADGWGDPVHWLRAAVAFFEARDDDRIAAACRSLLRKAGAPVPRRRPGDAELPGALQARNVTGREADVLEHLARGLTNREIAEQLFLSPRTVEKHVASLLVKTGLRRRSELAGYFAKLDS